MDEVEDGDEFRTLLETGAAPGFGADQAAIGGGDPSSADPGAGTVHLGCASGVIFSGYRKPPPMNTQGRGPNNGHARPPSRIAPAPIVSAGTVVVLRGTGGNCGVGGGWTVCLFHWPHGPAPSPEGAGCLLRLVLSIGPDPGPGAGGTARTRRPLMAPRLRPRPR